LIRIEEPAFASPVEFVHRGNPITPVAGGTRSQAANYMEILPVF
jgi:hypothetical protein